ncbi:site-specific integrase, partial [Acidocella sp. KAb 2-4]|nr:site-specific integrase [Acidocella sp. KAb 2-4]
MIAAPAAAPIGASVAPVDLAQDVGGGPKQKRRPRGQANRVRHDPEPQPRPLSAARLIEVVSGWTDQTPARRAALVTAIRHGEKIQAACPDKLRGLEAWSCAALNACLWAHQPRFFGLSQDAHRNAVSGLRYILIRVGHHADAGYGRNRLRPEWQKLYAALPTSERQRGLILFLRYLTLRAIEPEAVAPAHLDDFEAWCRTEILHKDAGGLGRRTAGNWAFARDAVPGWPQTELTRTGMRDHYGIPWDKFPRSFQDDAERYLTRLADGPGAVFKSGNPFAAMLARAKAAGGERADGQPPAGRHRSPRSVPRALKPRTVTTRRDQIKMAATALVQSGTPLDQLTSLSVLVTPLDHPATILHFHRERLRHKLEAQLDEVREDDLRSSNLIGLGETLRQIAEYVAQLPAEEIDELKAMLSFVRPAQQQGMSEKNRVRLGALLAEPVCTQLLHLPSFWMGGKAADPELDPKQQALAAMFATALEILLFMPARRDNALKLRLDTHLRRPAGGKLITDIFIPGRDVKNSQALSWPIEEDSAQRIETYLRQYRPRLAAPGNPYLFPGISDGPRNAAEFAAEFSKRVEAELGVEFNMHLVRHFAAVRYLKAHPGAYEIVSLLLGHRNPETTRRFYLGLEQEAAARHANQVLLGERGASKI